MDRIFFKEEQRFTSPWIWLLLISAFLASFIPQLYFYYQVPIPENTSVFETEAAKSLLISMGLEILVFGLIFFLLAKIKLITEIREGGFYYRYPPIINKEKKIAKEEIERYEVRQYKPLREYGGWGVRQGTGKAGKAYNVKGKTGLQLYLKNGKKVLFGTQRGDALRRAMDKMMKEY
ncbi:MAG: hypothetical protein GXO86_03750 [Chlorobi bacterium]|nr:hypothetical protein [Chlorobiota bacterium]